MADIRFNAHYGNEIRQVILSFNEWGTGGHQVYINKSYYGDLHCFDGRWVLHSNTNLLSIDDIQILGEIIIQKKPQ